MYRSPVASKHLVHKTPAEVKMSLRSRRSVQLLLPVIAAMCLSAAPQQQLNPTVKVLPAALTPVPAECEEGLAPQPQPRVTEEEKAVAREVAAPPEMKAPPTNDLRSTLTAVQTAAERNDRAAFVDALPRLKTMLATYPTGGERSAGEKAVAVYDDLDRVWAYQLTPAGAFFDASSDLYKVVSQYPGFDTFIRRNILTDQNGAKFYPTSESRVFLTQVAAARLQDLGIGTPAPAAQTVAVPPPPASPTPKSVEVKKTPTEKRVEHPAAEQPKMPATKRAEHRAPASKTVQTAKAPTAKAPTTKATTTKATTNNRSTTKASTAKATTTKASTKPKEAHVAAAGPAPKRRATAPAKSATAKTAAIAPKPTEAAPPKASTPSTPLKSAAPLTATAPSATTGAPPAAAPSAGIAAPPTGTAVSTATQAAPVPSSTETTASAAPATDTTATVTTGTSGETKEGKPNEPRNLLMPIILIVVGVGVLILLFRTSSGK